MANSNYRRGVQREYRTKQMLERTGVMAFRMAGSHSPFDVIGVSSHGFRLIQVKSGSAGLTAAEKESLKTIPRPANSTIELWRWPARSREPIIEVIA